MRISDWSSDVCSSDLHPQDLIKNFFLLVARQIVQRACQEGTAGGGTGTRLHCRQRLQQPMDKQAAAEATPRIRPERRARRSEEHTSELQSLMRISYAVFCLKKQKVKKNDITR